MATRTKYKLIGEPKGVAFSSCTPLDHVFPRQVRGAFCFCEQRQWGIERKPTHSAFALNDKGHVTRQVWQVQMRQPPIKDRPYWMYVLALKGCGHIAFKRADGPTKFTRVRCRMCESRFKEVHAKQERQEEKKAMRADRKKRAEEKQRWREQRSKVLRVRLPKRVAGRKGGSGRGGSKTRTFVIRSSGRRKRG